MDIVQNELRSLIKKSFEYAQRTITHLASQCFSGSCGLLADALSSSQMALQCLQLSLKGLLFGHLQMRRETKQRWFVGA